MNKLISYCAIILLSVSVLPALAQSNKKTAGKIAVINLERAVFSTDEAKERLKKLNARTSYKRQKRKVESLQKEGRKLSENLRKDEDVLGSDERRDIVKQISILREDIEHEGKKLKQLQLEVLEGLRDEMGPLLEDIIQEIIDEQEIGLLLRDLAQLPYVFYADNYYDITAKVTIELNKEYTKLAK